MADEGNARGPAGRRESLVTGLAEGPVPVLALLPSFGLGGAETQIASLLLHLDRSKYRPLAACQHALGPVADDLQSAGIPVHLLSGAARVDFGFGARLIHLLRKERVGICLSHGFSTGVMLRLAGLATGVKVRLLAEHSTGERDMTPGRHRLNQLLEPWATGHVYVAAAQRKYLLQTKGIPEHKLVLIRNGIDLRRFTLPEARGKSRAEWGVQPSDPVAGIIAGLRPEKDHKTFLLAARFVLDELPEARFVIVGDGPLRADLEREVAALDLTRNVIFLGERRDIPEILSGLDLAVLTSTDVETLPMSFLEAMAASLPLVATRVGGLDELVHEGVNGHLVRPRDAQGLAEAMKSILRSPQIQNDFGAASRRIAEQDFTRERMVRDYEALFDRLLNEPRKRTRRS